MNKLVFATNNKHKLEELRAIVGDKYEILGLRDIGCDVDIPETATTLEGNAIVGAYEDILISTIYSFTIPDVALPKRNVLVDADEGVIV